MKRTGLRKAKCAAFSLMLLMCDGGLRGQDEVVIKLEAAFSEALSRVESPLTEFETKYVENLNAQIKTAQERGDLNAALAGKKEVESFRQPGRRDFDSWPELKRLREIYEATRSKLAREVSEGRVKLYAAYRQQLEPQMERLTKEGNLDAAIKVKRRIEELDVLIQKGNAAPVAIGGAPSAEEGETLWEFKSRASVEPINNCDLKTVSGALVITSERRDGAFQNSRRTFKPPFRIRAKVSTDSTNIRFYYNNKPLVIFNWEVTPTELRVHDPRTGASSGFAGKGLLEINKMHDLEIDVLADKVSVKSNGVLLAEKPADCKELDAAVGLGPAFESVISVESLKVLALKP